LVSDFGGNDFTPAQINQISAIVDIGFLLNRDHHDDADTSIQTGTIQAAIWDIEHPGSVTLVDTGVRFTDYQNYYSSYRTLDIPADRVFTIIDDATNPA